MVIFEQPKLTKEDMLDLEKQDEEDKEIRQMWLDGELDLIDKFEFHGVSKYDIFIDIAVQLKRIADSLERREK